MSYDPTIIERFRKLATASVADAVDKVAGQRGYMQYEIKPRAGTHKIVGPAATVLEGPTDEPQPPTHALDTIDESDAGTVLVIGVGGERDVAVWGGLMTAGAVANQLAGAVLDAGVRDVSEIERDFDFTVYARTVSPGTTVGRYRTLDKGVPVDCGGVTVHPGDLIVADRDGVVVVPRAHVDGVLDMAEDIERKEAEQTRFILETGSLREGLAKYDRI